MLYCLLYTTASLPMMLGPKAQALSYHVPTKYLFLPNSQAQSLEIPYFVKLVTFVAIYPKRFVSIVVYQFLQQTSAAPCGALDVLMFANDSR